MLPATQVTLEAWARITKAIGWTNLVTKATLLWEGGGPRNYAN